MKSDYRRLLAAAIVLTMVFTLSLSAQAKGTGAMSTQTQYKLDPQSWVRLGIDYDGDGGIDQYQYVLGYDLIQAREKSRERIARARMQRQQRFGKARGYYPEERGYAPGRGYRRPEWADALRTDRVEGTIRSLKTVRLVGMDQAHRIARVETRAGRIARVDLGPKENLSRLDLQQGDRITVHGNRGTLDEKSYLMARRIQARGGNVRVNRPSDGGLQRYAGRILKVRTASFEQHDVPDQIMARVRLDQGITTVVNLGSRNQLQDELDTSLRNLEGKNVELIAHRARVGNKTALVADQLRVGNQLVSIDWSGHSPRMKVRTGRR
jgi:hypothetical protein